MAPLGAECGRCHLPLARRLGFALPSARSDVPCFVWSLIRKCEPWNRYIDFLANSPRVLDGRGKDGRPGAEPQLVDEPLRLSPSRPQAIAKIGARARLER